MSGPLKTPVAPVANVVRFSGGTGVLLRKRPELQKHLNVT